MHPTFPAVARVAASLLAVSLAGCATLTGSSTQTIDVSTVDARDRPVRGMTCTVSHGPGTYVFDTPVSALEIRRSATDLEIECRRGSQVAKGTVIARGDSAMAHSFIPGGSLATLVDYATGAMYTYPSPLRLKIGQHLKFEAGGEARASVVANVGEQKAPVATTKTAGSRGTRETTTASTQ